MGITKELPKDLQLPMPSMHIPIPELKSHSDEVYWMQQYVIKLSLTCGQSMIFSGYSDVHK